MAAGPFFKVLDSKSPNLSLQSNQAIAELWGTAGRLSGLNVTAVALVAPANTSILITLSPGSFVHNGIIVKYPQGTQVTVLLPVAFSTTEPFYLLAQSNGPGPAEADAPIFAFISRAAFLLQPDSKNYAAIIGIYNLVVQQESQALIGFTGDSAPLAWTPSSGTIHYKILNGEIAGFLSAAGTGQDDAIEMQNLAAGGRVTSIVLSLTVAADYALATVATGSVTFAGANSVIGDVFSAYADGAEFSYTETVAQTPTALAAAFAAAINLPGSAWDGIATATSALGVVTITSVAYGRLGNFDLQVTETSATTTLVVSAPMSGGTQSYIVVDFPVIGTGTTGILPMTVYPPITPSGTPSANVFDIAVPIPVESLTTDTFNNMLFRIEANGSLGSVYMHRALLTVDYLLAAASLIDPAPPLTLSHWLSGPNYSIGGAEDSTMGAHRLLTPIDHPDRSVTRAKIAFRAVGALEVSAGVVGDGFTEGFHTPAQLTQPWLISTDLNLEEVSDAVKGLAQVTGTGFGKDHSTATGHHRGAKYDDVIAGAGNNGMLVEPVASNDVLTPTGDTTHGQFFVLSESGTLDRSAATYVRTAVLGPVAGTRKVVGISSQELSQEFGGGANTEIGLEIVTEAGVRKARFSRTEAGAKGVYGVGSLNDIPTAGLQGNRMSLFSGSVVYLRAGAGNTGGIWDPRTSGSASVYPDRLLGTGATDVTASPGVQGSSFIPEPAGCVLYADPARDSDFAATQSPTATTVAENSSWIGHFQNPLLTRDGALGTQWLYLPFFKKDIFSRIEVQVTIVQTGKSNTTSSASGDLPNYGYAYGGFLAAPAYDVREYGSPPNVTVPAFAPASAPFNTKPAGVVRRHPWVLTPTGLNRPIGSVTGGMDYGCYYDPRNGGATYDPYAYFKRTDFTLAPLDRVSSLPTALIPGTSFVAKGPLPYYDIRAVGEVAVGGILVNAGQTVAGVGTQSVVTQTANNRIVRTTFSLSVALPLKNGSNAFVTEQSRTPDGVAICPMRFDWGMANKTAANVIGGTIGSPGPTVELPGLVTIDIVGIVDGRYSPIIL